VADEKPVKKKPTRGKGEGAVYKDARGLWTATIELPSHDGTRRRKTVRAKSKSEALQKMDDARALLRKRGDIHTNSLTVEQWFLYWHERVVVPKVRPKTAVGYRHVIEKHIAPIIGKVKLDKVAPLHLRKVTDYVTITLGLSPTTALHTHKTMAAGFEIAMREGRIGVNPAKMMDAPRKAIAQLDVLDLAESIQVLRHVTKDREYGARWATALLTGARRGEVLGLERDRVTDVLDLSWQLQRLTWQHGCGDPKITAGGKKRFPCLRGQGTICPDRKLEMPTDYEVRKLTEGLYLTRPKSKAGWRIVPLVDPLASFLRAHMEANPSEGLVFTKNGKPVDPEKDSAAWRTVLSETGIKKNVRLHDLRHSAVDLLLEAGMPIEDVMLIVGHSTRAMTAEYRSRGNSDRLRRGMVQMGELFTLQPRPEVTVVQQDALGA